jgi:hypothetical protein
MTRVLPRTLVRPLLFLAALAAAWAATRGVGDLGSGWLLLTPALLLALPLLAGRYVGERTLRRLAASRPARRSHAAEPRVPLWRSRTVVAHGGLLLARRIAGRAPPATALLAS